VDPRVRQQAMKKTIIVPGLPACNLVTIPTELLRLDNGLE